MFDDRTESAHHPSVVGLRVYDKPGSP